MVCGSVLIFLGRTLLTSNVRHLSCNSRVRHKRYKCGTEKLTPSLPVGQALFEPASVHGWRLTQPEGRAKLEMTRCLPGFLLVGQCGAPKGGDRSKHKEDL